MKTPLATLAVFAVVLGGCVGEAPGMNRQSGSGVSELSGEPVALKEAPAKEPAKESPKGDLFASDAAQAESAGPVVWAKEDRADTSWATLWLRASPGEGVHYNLNQAAKGADSNATEWSRIFTPDAPFRSLDGLFFCGPIESITVQVADATDWSLVFEGIVEGVQPC